MDNTKHPQIRELLLTFATLVVSVASLLPLMWAFFHLGDYGGRDTNAFPIFMRDAAIVSLVIVVVGAFAIGSCWRSNPGLLSFVAAAPYLLFATGSGTQGLVVWSSAGLVVFAIFYAVTRFSRVSNRPNITSP